MTTQTSTDPGQKAHPYRDPVTRWLLLVALLVFLMVIVGGFVRLSRAGLSIVEWDVVTGVIPPIGDAAWEASFADYKLTPEYLLVNQGMTLSEYQYIFYLEWAHRLIARIAGLIVVVPLIWFMVRGVISVRESLRYWGIAALFGIQGAIGWIMVSSGLQDRPTVSHFRLTIHLLAALVLLGLTLWMALDRIRDASPTDRRLAPASTAIRALTWAVLATTVLQIAYGGLVAGLKAGHVSNTWPLMFGYLVPPNLLSVVDPWWMNLFEPLGSHWVHRWLAFVVTGFAIALFVLVRRERPTDGASVRSTIWLLGALGVQIGLGVATVLLNVPKWFALTHQGVGMAVFCIALVSTHRITAAVSDSEPVVASQPTS
jgi:cytochrome c oxidase assembly protein subunit 15